MALSALLVPVAIFADCCPSLVMQMLQDVSHQNSCPPVETPQTRVPANLLQ